MDTNICATLACAPTFRCVEVEHESLGWQPRCETGIPAMSVASRRKADCNANQETARFELRMFWLKYDICEEVAVLEELVRVARSFQYISTGSSGADLHGLDQVDESVRKHSHRFMFG